MSAQSSPSPSPSPSPSSAKPRMDYFFWLTLSCVLIFYIYGAMMEMALISAPFVWLHHLGASVFEIINIIWWGLLLGVVMVALLSKIPREFVIALLGRKKGFGSILRAVGAGLLLDLCNHGILMVATKLYERGVSGGQFMAFLIASPWNSFSLTLILIALLGWGWTLLFIFLSMVIAVIAGMIFELCVERHVFPDNPNRAVISDDFRFFEQARLQLTQIDYRFALLREMAVNGLSESKMVMRWIFFGVLMASAVRAFMDIEMFETYFAPSLLGLSLTLLLATILEICSEGSTPLAADMLTRAKAPGNSFAFLMAGVASDYTEIMVVRDMTKSWAIALFLPMAVLPQVILFSLWLNSLGG